MPRIVVVCDFLELKNQRRLSKQIFHIYTLYVGFNNLLSKSLIQSTSFNLSLISESISKDLLPVMSLSQWCKTNLSLHQYIDHANRMNQAADDHNVAQSKETKAIYKDNQLAFRQQALISWKRLQEEYRANRSSLYINRVVVSNLNGNFLQILLFRLA